MALEQQRNRSVDIQPVLTPFVVEMEPKARKESKQSKKIKDYFKVKKAIRNLYPMNPKNSIRRRNCSNKGLIGTDQQTQVHIVNQQ